METFRDEADPGGKRRRRFPTDANAKTPVYATDVFIERTGRDSNPRYPYKRYVGLANRCLQPLGHLSQDANCSKTHEEFDRQAG